MKRFPHFVFRAYSSTDEGLPSMTSREQRVTPLELFFDLVFVYAITQVTAR